MSRTLSWCAKWKSVLSGMSCGVGGLSAGASYDAFSSSYGFADWVLRDSA